MSIVTFYSYKGGVGRSMALANVAVLLARRGLKVLAVDWDLEAPGLERYFGYFEIKQGGPGLLRMFMEARDGFTRPFTDFTSSIDCGAPHPLLLLSSGREQDEEYSRNLEAFDWDEFFEKDGGAYVENLRNLWRENFDVVLIDSRTGLSDTGGICTIQLPDIVVAMFTANHQSLFGVRDVMRLAQKARQGLAYDRMPLSILPLPARWGTQEFKETQIWLGRVADCVQEFCDDWLPRTLRARTVIETIKVPQSNYFGFGEKLAVVEQGTSDPQGMGFVYDKVASFIASDFSDLRTLVGDLADPVAPSAPSAPSEPTLPTLTDSGYRYEVFVSHDGSHPEWLLEFVETLKASLATQLADAPRIFFDVQEIRLGDEWKPKLQDALLRSKILVALVTDRYSRNPVAQDELRTFVQRARLTGRPLVLPVIVSGDSFPEVIRQYQWLDLRKLPPLKNAAGSALWQRTFITLSDGIQKLLEDVPPFDPAWIAGPDPFAMS